MSTKNITIHDLDSESEDSSPDYNPYEKAGSDSDSDSDSNEDEVDKKVEDIDEKKVDNEVDDNEVDDGGAYDDWFDVYIVCDIDVDVDAVVVLVLVVVRTILFILLPNFRIIYFIKLKVINQWKY